MAGILKAFAILSVLAAYIFGLLSEERDCQEKLFLTYPDMTILSTSGKNPVCYQAKFPEGKKYVVLCKTMGWGGPALVSTRIDTSGYVDDVAVINHKETPAFFAQLQKKSFFEQYKGKYIADNFSIDGDVDVISGATISSLGFNKAVKESSHYLAAAEFQMEFAESNFSISYTDPAYFILLLFALAYFGTRFRLKKYLIIVQLISVVLLGFMLNYPLSVSHITSLLMGFFPSPDRNLIWYILLGSIGVMILFVGRNLYCAWICPFGAIQELLNKVSGISLPVSPILKKMGKFSSGFIAWFAVCVIFISRNPAVGSFEPFAALFSFKGFGIIWIILPVLIFSSFLIKRMWCRYFCPVGFFLNGSCKMRNKILNQLKSKNEKREVKIYGKHFDHCA